MAFIPVWLQLFGPTAYGRYAVAWAVAVACGSATAGWIRQAGLRTAGTPARLADLPPWAVIGSVLAAGFLTAGTTMLLGALSPTGACVAGMMACALVVAQLVATTLQREDRSWVFGASEVLKTIVTVTATLFVGWMTSAPGHVALMLGSVLGGAATLLFVGGRQGQLTRREMPLALWWRYGWPLSLWLAFAPVLLYSDRLVLQVVARPEVMGAFAALSDFTVRGLAAVGTPLSTAAHVWGMREYNAGNSARVIRLMRSFELAALLVTVLLATLVFAFRDSLADFVGTTQISPLVLPLLVAGGGLWHVAMFAHKPLELAGRTRTMLGLIMGAVTLEVVACAVLIPLMGVLGAAVGLVLGVATYVLACQRFARLGSPTA